MALSELQELANEVKYLTEKLSTEHDIVGQILQKYKEQVLVPKELLNTIVPMENDFTKKKAELLDIILPIENDFTEIKAALENLQKQATDKLVIILIGAVNAGKSSLINALLRKEILPSSCGEATMCSFKICTTEEESWSVQNGEGEKLYGKGVEEIRRLYSMMSDSKYKERREELNINTDSLVQVNWPQKLCQTLPENIILYDTPGIGNDEKVTDLVKKSCRTADIIVAVIDSMSPMLMPVSEVVNNVECKFTFGVYTKWDELMQRISRREACVDEEELQRKYKDDYLSKVYGRRESVEESEEGKQKVFFVDVGCLEHDNLIFSNCKGVPSTNLQEETDGTNGNRGFLNFEECLAQSAKEKKGEIIKDRAESITLKSVKILNKLQGTVEDGRKIIQSELNRLEVIVASWKSDRESLFEIKRNVRSTSEIMHATFTSDKIAQLTKEFEENVKGGKSQEEVLEKFLDSVNVCIKNATDTEMSKVNERYEMWKNNLKSSFRDITPSLPSYTVPKLERKELPRRLYNELVDPRTYLTSKVLWGIIITGSTVAAGLVAGKERDRIRAGGALGGLFSTAIAAVSNWFGGNSTMSQQHQAAWTKFHADEINDLTKREEWPEPVSDELNRIFQRISSEENWVSDESNKKKATLDTEMRFLNQWAKELKGIAKNVQDVKWKFEDLLGIPTHPEAESVDETENQSATSKAGISI